VIWEERKKEKKKEKEESKIIREMRRGRELRALKS
jgi:hypothetical protein